MTEAEIQQFQNTTKLIILPIANTNSPRLVDRRTPDGRAGIMVRVWCVCWDNGEGVVCVGIMVRVWCVCWDNGEGVVCVLG